MRRSEGAKGLKGPYMRSGATLAWKPIRPTASHASTCAVRSSSRCNFLGAAGLQSMPAWPFGLHATTSDASHGRNAGQSRQERVERVESSTPTVTLAAAGLPGSMPAWASARARALAYACHDTNKTGFTFTCQPSFEQCSWLACCCVAASPHAARPASARMRIAWESPPSTFLPRPAGPSAASPPCPGACRQWVPPASAPARPGGPSRRCCASHLPAG